MSNYVTTALASLKAGKAPDPHTMYPMAAPSKTDQKS